MIFPRLNLISLSLKLSASTLSRSRVRPCSLTIAEFADKVLRIVRDTFNVRGKGAGWKRTACLISSLLTRKHSRFSGVREIFF